MTSTLLVYQVNRLTLPNEDWRKLPEVQAHIKTSLLSESSYNEISAEDDSLLQWN